MFLFSEASNCVGFEIAFGGSHERSIEYLEGVAETGSCCGFDGAAVNVRSEFCISGFWRSNGWKVVLFVFLVLVLVEELFGA
jgi:hypothetical protein